MGSINILVRILNVLEVEAHSKSTTVWSIELNVVLRVESVVMHFGEQPAASAPVSNIRTLSLDNSHSQFAGNATFQSALIRENAHDRRCNLPNSISLTQLRRQHSVLHPERKGASPLL